jgi:hypothetical protein
MGIKEIGREGIHWSNFAMDREKFRALENTTTNTDAPKDA